MSAQALNAEVVLGSAPDAIVVVGVDNLIVFVNAEADRTFGYQQDELLGHPIDLLLPGASSDFDAGRHEGAAPRTVARHTTRSELVGRRNDGTEFLAEVSWSVVHTDRDRVVVVSARDATDRRRGEAQANVLLESAPDAIVAVGPDGCIALVNAQAQQLFGYERAELMGMPVETLVPALRGMHRGLRDGYLAHPLARPMGAATEVAGRRKDGGEFPAEISLSAIDTDHGMLVWVVVRDGSDRKEAAMISSSNDAIISQSLDGTITSWNPSAVRLFGYEADDVLGQNGDILLPARHHAEQIAVLARTALGERVLEYDAVRLRADGSTIDVATKVSPIVNDGGIVVGASVIARDITDRTRAADERRALEEQLNQSQRLESLGQLAGGIAHDFNNLLAVIINYATFVGEAVEDNEPVRADVAEIRIAAERAAALTHQLLIFGRRETVQPVILDLNAVVADVQTLLSRTIGEQVEIIVHAAPDMPTVWADRGQLEQVLVNLAVNARDAMPDGGALTIETSVVALDEVSALHRANLQTGRYVTLSVSDSGDGMSPDVRARAFDPFFTTKPRGEGSGLGLATVYGIATEAGGTVILHSEGGLGTTVRVYLPAADQPATVGEEPPLSSVPQGHGQTILVVEDEPAVRSVALRLLRRNGYEVLEAASGDHALTILGEYACDLLVTDVVMPHMSGLDLAEHVHERSPSLPVLFMSGYSQGVLGRDRPLDERFTLIQKPFGEQALLEKVRSALATATTNGAA